MVTHLWMYQLMQLHKWSEWKWQNYSYLQNNMIIHVRNPKRKIETLLEKIRESVRYFISKSAMLISNFSVYKNSVQFSSVTQSCPTLCNPMDCSMPGFLVYHQHLEFTQTHVHWVSDAIQSSHPLLSLSPPVLNLSQH